jgi:hypothetical protein
VTVIRHQNVDAIVLAGELLGGIYPPDNIQTDRHPREMPLGTGWNVAAVTLIDLLLCVLISARVVTASVYGNCRVTNHDDGFDGMQHVRTAYLFL